MISELAGAGTKAIVLDANILIRAVLGRRAFALLEDYAQRVSFLTPEIAFSDVAARLPNILTRRGSQPDDLETLLGHDILGRLRLLVIAVASDAYAAREHEARRRLARRDELDWPYLALALTVDCPIWTEDQDFFGSGVATWTTDRVEFYLSADG